MVSDACAISVSHLSKMYRIYSRPADMFMELLTGRSKSQEFWALKDLSFEVRRGEVVGIVGRNGAGKSTLLKIVAGTLDKTSGDLMVQGNISAILELGTGFHPEYSGRENIVLGGMCLGMSRQEINEKSEQIIDFSEIRPFIDQPFKTYSSGMQARLTFATAISVEPEILIIDEALATGDSLFAEKCFRRIREITQNGTTVLFVTHALNAVYELCDSAILMHQGELLFRDEPRIIGYEYDRILLRERDRYSLVSVAKIAEPKITEVQAPSEMVKPELEISEGVISEAKDSTLVVSDVVTSEVGNSENGGASQKLASPLASSEINGEKAQVVECLIIDSEGRSVTTLDFEQEYKVHLLVQFFDALDKVNVSFRIQHPTGLVITGYNSIFEQLYISGKAGEKVDVVFKFRCTLSNGAYVVGGGLARPLSSSRPLEDFEQIHFYYDKLLINVVGNPKCLGVFDLNAGIEIHRVL